MTASYSCSAEMHNRCANNALCHLCDGIRLFKDPVAERQEKLRIREEKKQQEKQSLLKTHQKEKKEGMAFEKEVAKQWNDKFGSKTKKKVAKPRIDLDEVMEKEEKQAPPTHLQFPQSQAAVPYLSPSKPKAKPPEAKRQANSGAMWHAKGDITLEHALMECKERGTTSAKGEKQITIPKLWLEKQEKEAFQEQKPYWYLPFRYKGDEAIYLVKPYDHEMEMIYEYRKAREKIEELENELRILRQSEGI